MIAERADDESYAKDVGGDSPSNEPGCVGSDRGGRRSQQIPVHNPGCATIGMGR